MTYKNTIFILMTISLIAAGCEKGGNERNGNDGPQLRIEEKAAKANQTPKVDDKSAKKTDAKPAQKKLETGSENKSKISNEDAKLSLVGTWVLTGHDCQSGNGLIFTNGAKYASETAEGNWAINNGKLKINAKSEESSENFSLNIVDINEKSAVFQRDDGSNVEWTRCNNVPNL